MSDLLERLETFSNGHKARSVKIGHPNGYGSSTWVVELTSERGPINVAGVSFFYGQLLPDCYTVQKCFASPEEEDAFHESLSEDDPYWEKGSPTITEVLELALSKAEEKLKTS